MNEQEPPDVILRPATPADAQDVAEIYLASRKTFLSFAPPAHTDEEIKDWIAHTLIPAGGVTVAIAESGVAGFIAISRDSRCAWIQHLYLHPSAVGRGIGTQLLRHAMNTQSSPVRLFTFQANEGARRFYERHGFRAIAFSDGNSNEERCPDVLYEYDAGRTGG